MGYIRGFFISGCVALAGAGGGVIALNLHSSSPRIMAVGIASAVIGIIGGGIALGMSMTGPLR
ncbi:MAG TPA: hypothetical protein VMU87_21700 [Stellaceae bacterium]|nr:hypothetical protein [Stellaceae bacterium]